VSHFRPSRRSQPSQRADETLRHVLDEGPLRLRGENRSVACDEIDLDLHVDEDQRSLQDRMESAERVTRSTEALRPSSPTRRERCC
jgi:hypothetical protein